MFIHIDPDSRLGKFTMVAGLPLFAAFLVFQVQCFSRALKSYRWPAAAGSVVESRVDRSRDVHGLPTSEAEVRYIYTVAGRERENDTIAFGVFRGMLTWGYADSKVDRYPKGRVVSVYYDPERPNVSCLEQGGLGWEDVFMVIVSVAGIFFGTKTVKKAIWRGPQSATLTATLTETMQRDAELSDARAPSAQSVLHSKFSPRSP